MESLIEQVNFAQISEGGEDVTWEKVFLAKWIAYLACWKNSKQPMWHDKYKQRGEDEKEGWETDHVGVLKTLFKDFSFKLLKPWASFSQHKKKTEWHKSIQYHWSNTH